MRQNNNQIIKQINDAVERRANNALRKEGLTLVQMWVLMELSEKSDKTYSLKELEKILGVAQSTCAGIVTRLEKKGLVASSTDESDKRIKIVTITKAGEVFCKNTNEDISNLEQLMFKGVDKDDRAICEKVLNQIYENIK